MRPAAARRRGEGDGGGGEGAGAATAEAFPGARRRSSRAALGRTQRSHARFGAGQNRAGGAVACCTRLAAVCGRRWYQRKPGSGVRGPGPGATWERVDCCVCTVRDGGKREASAVAV